MDVTTKPTLVLIGDSTLDNVVWVPGQQAGVRDHLVALLPAFEVVNLAADGFTSEDVLNGGTALISVAARRAAGDPFPVDPGLFRPLELLKRHADAAPHILLSVGGNDVREVLAAMDRLPAKIARLHSNYPEIVARARAVSPRVVLMLQYRPCFDTPGDYGVYAAVGSLPGPGTALGKLHGLLEQVYAPIFALARMHGLPIIDLPHTFDPANGRLYLHQIEPSAEGGRVIANLVAHVLNHHNFGTDGSVFYAQPILDGPIEATPNDGAHPWRLIEQPSTPVVSGAQAVPAPAPAPESLFFSQLAQLRELGFLDHAANVQALVATAGNLELAVNALLL